MQSMTYLGVLHTAASGHPASGGHATITTTGSVSGGTLLVLLVIGWAVWKVRSPATVAGGVGKTVRGTWKTIVAVWKPIRAVVRFYGGRELRGEPRSTATFLRAGTRTGQAAKPAPAVTMESVAAATPRVSLVKPVRRQPSPWARKAAHWFDTYRGRGAGALDTAVRVALWVARIVGRLVRACRAIWRGLRAVYGVVAPVVATLATALRSWGCWPYAARGLTRLALTAAALGLLVPAWRLLTLLLLLLALAGAVAAAYRYQPKKPGDDAVYGPRLWAILREDLKLPEEEDRKSWLLLPERLADPGARITIRLPWTFRGSQAEKDNVAALINTRLPGEWVGRYTFTGEHFTAVYTHKPAPRPKAPEPEPPASVGIWDPAIQAELATLAPDQFLLGIDENGQAVIQKMADEQAHWALSVGSGGGKSAFLHWLSVQMLMKRGTVIPIDPKMISMTPLLGIQGVHSYVDPQSPRDMRAALLWITEVVRARNFEKKTKRRTSFEPIYAILEECNELADLLKEEYSAKKQSGDGAADPIWRDAVAKILRLGREVNVHLIAVFQDFKDTQFGGVSLVPLFPFKILGSYSERQWKRIIGNDTAMPTIQKKAGRMVVVLDTGNVTRFQVPYVPFDPDKTKDQNQQAAYARLTAYYKELRATHGYSTAGLYTAPPTPSPEEEPALLKAASRDAGLGGPNGGSGGGAGEETAGGLSRSGDTVTLPDGSVTGQRDRLRLIPGQGGQEATSDPTAPPELLSLAEVARRLEGEQGVPNGTTMRAHKVRYDDFPQPTVINGKELFTESQIRAYYQAREQKA